MSPMSSWPDQIPQDEGQTLLPWAPLRPGGGGHWCGFSSDRCQRLARCDCTGNKAERNREGSVHGGGGTKKGEMLLEGRELLRRWARGFEGGKEADRHIDTQTDSRPTDRDLLTGRQMEGGRERADSRRAGRYRDPFSTARHRGVLYREEVRHQWLKMCVTCRERGGFSREYKSADKMKKALRVKT
jgi:hypothetical protein